MTKRIFRSILLIALAAALLLSALVTLALYRATESRLMEELHAETGYILHALERELDEAAYFSGFTSDNRVTLIGSDGSVLYDSTTDAARLGNHADRPEIAGALATGHGETKRYSDTFGAPTLYYAALTDDGNVLRVSNTVGSVWSMLTGVVYPLAGVLLGVVLLAFITARKTAERIVSPINALDLDDPLSNTVYDELSPLLTRMARQKKEIAAQMTALAEKQNELSAITEHMREGLILLDPAGAVLAMNASAAKIFGVSASARVGGNLLTVTRDPSVSAAVSGALAGSGADAALERNGRHYQALANPVVQRGRTVGVVLLLLDVTESRLAELSRREFTANVSHELKTPLTSISGYAEIMRDGVAKPEDTREFAGRIYSEANRLIALVNDILELSRLDEQKGLGEKSRVDLLPIAQETAKRLMPAAAEKQIALTVEGEHAAVMGFPALLDEMAFNLCDNAIKYTNPGGSVCLRVSNDGGQPAFSVADTGVGIPIADQPHVFERFYRVDKSHSKATGGTGLGLSIVKHVAAAHGASIALESEPGKGTCVRVRFADA